MTERSTASADTEAGAGERPGPGEQYCTACRAVIPRDADRCPSCGADHADGDGDGFDLPFGWIVGTAGALALATYVALYGYYRVDDGVAVAAFAALIATAALSMLYVKIAVVVGLLVDAVRG